MPIKVVGKPHDSLSTNIKILVIPNLGKDTKQLQLSQISGEKFKTAQPL